MNVKREECTGRRPVHFFEKLMTLAAVLAFAAIPEAAAAQSSAPVAQQAAHGQSVADFYRGRNNYPLWLAPTSGDAAQQLIALLSSANLDGLDPDQVEDILAVHPRGDFKNEFLRAYHDGMKDRPETTNGTVNSDVLEHFVPGFRRTTTVERILGSAWPS